MHLKHLEWQVSKTVNTDTRPRPTTGYAWPESSELEDGWAKSDDGW